LKKGKGFPFPRFVTYLRGRGSGTGSGPFQTRGFGAEHPFFGGHGIGAGPFMVTFGRGGTGSGPFVTATPDSNSKTTARCFIVSPFLRYCASLRAILLRFKIAIRDRFGSDIVAVSKRMIEKC